MRLALLVAAGCKHIGSFGRAMARRKDVRITAGGLAVVIAAFVAVQIWRPETYSVDMDRVSRAFAAGLDTDPFYDKSADPVTVLKRRDEILQPPGSSLRSSEREARLRILYLLALGSIETMDQAGDPGARQELRRAAERYATRAQIEVRELPGESFAKKRFEANVRFLRALVWVIDMRVPDAGCLDDLRFAKKYSDDYRTAAKLILSHTPRVDHYGQGLDAMAKGDNPSAATEFTRHLKTFPNDIEARRWRGLCRLRQGALDLALDDLNQCVAHDSGDVVALEARGHVFFRQGHIAEATMAWQMAERISPERAPLLREFVRVAQEGK